MILILLTLTFLLLFFLISAFRLVQFSLHLTRILNRFFSVGVHLYYEKVNKMKNKKTKKKQVYKTENSILKKKCFVTRYIIFAYPF